MPLSSVPPSGLELGQRLGVVHVLEAGELVGQSAHVAAALHVVLAAQGHQPGAPPADMTGEQSQIAQRHHVVHGVVMLGDAQRPQDLRLVGGGVGVGHLDDRLGGHAGLAFCEIERVGLHVGGVVLESPGGVGYEILVVQTRVDYLASHGVGERYVGAHRQAQPAVRELRRRGAARIHREHAGPVVEALEEMVEEDRMRFTGVGAPQQDHVGFLYLLV